MRRHGARVRAGARRASAAIGRIKGVTTPACAPRSPKRRWARARRSATVCSARPSKHTRSDSSPVPLTACTRSPAPAIALPDRPFHYAVLYLAPGDYHRVHSPAALRFERRRRVSGALLPVNPIVTRGCLDCTPPTRGGLRGAGRAAKMSMTAVGASVGSIKLLAGHERGAQAKRLKRQASPATMQVQPGAALARRRAGVCVRVGLDGRAVVRAPAAGRSTAAPCRRAHVRVAMGTCGRTRSTARSALLRRSAAGFS